MSYDLSVYSREGASGPELEAFVSASPGLQFEASVAGHLSVVRGVKRKYSFAVGGPERVEAEDVPDEVAATVLGPRFLWTVGVEGSDPVEVPHAVRFARRLAQALDGAVVDQQTGELWTRSKSRIVPGPPRETRISMVDLRWFCLRDNLPQDVAGLYIDKASRLLPEALPRRYGEYEPLQGKYADRGRRGFEEAWQHATGHLFFMGSRPVIAGSMNAGPSDRYPQNFWSMSISVLHGPLIDEQWRTAVRHFLATLAADLAAFFATAQVTRGHLWNGRTTAHDFASELGENTLRHQQGWLGLPPRPSWLTWFGGPYLDVVANLPSERCSPTARGILYEASAAPLPWDQLEGLQQWLGPELFAVPLPNERGQRPTPLGPAPSIPAPLRVPPGV